MNQVKKVLASFVGVLIIVTSLFAVTASAQVNPEKGQYKAGTVFRYSLYLPSDVDSDFCGIDFIVKYNSDKLSFNQSTTYSFLNDAITQVKDESGNLRICAALGRMDYMISGGQLVAAVEFVLNEDAAADELPFNYSITDIVNNNFEQITDKFTEKLEVVSTPETEAPTQPETLVGDLDGDSAVTVSDYLIIAGKYAHADDMTAEEIAKNDLNKDGKFDANDVTMLRALILE